MTQYRYLAARPTGRCLRGLEDASSVRELEEALAGRGLVALECEPMPERRRRTPPPRALATMFRSIADLRLAGVPLDNALKLTEALAAGPLLQSLRTARRKLAQGSSLADALADPPGLIPELVLGMLRAGERTGRLTPALRLAADHLERDAEVRARIQQALAYPAVLVAGGTLSFGIIGFVVLPRFAALLEELDQGLPPLAALLVTTVHLLEQWGWLIAVACVGLVVTLYLWLQSERGRVLADRVLLDTPGVGSSRHAAASGRVLVALATGLEAGVPLLVALESAATAAGSRTVELRLHDAAVLLGQGRTLAGALRDSRAVPALALDLVAIGEGSGQLTQMCRRAGVLMGEQSERLLNNAVRFIEPAVVILFSGGTALLAGTLLQAVYGMRPAP